MKRNKGFKIIAIAFIVILILVMTVPAAYAVTSPGELDLLNLIPKELFIIAIAVFLLIEFIKRTEKVPNWVIPIITLIIAIIFTTIYMAIVLEHGLSDKTIINGVIYGIIIASFNTFSYEITKQILVKRLE